MKWHLVDVETDAVLRTAEAASVGEARFRLAPIPTGAVVLSAVSYGITLPKHKPLPIIRRSRKHREKAERTERQRAVQRQRLRNWRARKRGEVVERGYVHPYDDYKRRMVLAGNVHGVYDAQIGAVLGISQQRIKELRRELGLPAAYDRVRMQVRAYHSLGWNDAQIGARLGKAHNVIYKIRRKLGLPANWGSTRRERGVQERVA